WVSDFKRVQSHREYELLSGDTRVLRARANWVFVDATNLRPMRLLPEFSDAYQPSGEELEDLQVHLDNPTLIENPRQFTRQHHVQHYEMDKLWHVNNANYIRWTEEACLRALQSLGWDEKTQG